MKNSFNAKSTLTVAGQDYRYFHLGALADQYNLDRLPFCLKILLENLLRKEDGKNVSEQDIHTLCRWQGSDEASEQVNFTPARVVLQDFTGVPAVVDLAAMRAAMRELKGDPAKINPLGAVDLVIDHSVMVDYYGSADALAKNTEIEFQRNNERYQFLRWGQQAFSNFRVVPPGTGIVHQVNLEYLAKTVLVEEQGGERLALPDTLVGTDSHTTMINGLGVLGWGVGGIEAEAAMLGQPITMLIPEVVGFELKGELPPSATATDLVLTVTQMLREHGVVGKFVEFFGAGLANLPLADRATIANMAPEYGATCGIFPIDDETLNYLTLTGRTAEQIELVEAYAKAQGLWRGDDDPVADYSDILTLDMGDVVPSLAGPKRPQDRIALTDAQDAFRQLLTEEREEQGKVLASSDGERFASEGGQTAIDNTNVGDTGGVPVEYKGEQFTLQPGAVVIAAITSCTNTSNPAVLVAAGLVAEKARALGLTSKPWVKTSFAPGSQVVPAYMQNAGLLEPLAELGFNIVGFGCTTCIGNSGPLPDPIQNAIRAENMLVTGVLSGNRNFEGRIHQDVRANYLASPPLVVAYALAGNMNIDLLNEPLGTSQDGKAVYLKDIWPTPQEVAQTIGSAMTDGLYSEKYADVFAGTPAWQALPVPDDDIYTWPDSTYVKKPPYFEGMNMQLPEQGAIQQARCLVKVGDSITTDHISPAGAIKPDSPAGLYLKSQGVEQKDFNSYGSRRGNHEVMVRGTFANVRLKNKMAPGTEGGWTTYLPTDEQMSIYDASQKYQADKVPLIVLAGKEYGTGSSRDWAAKGTNLLGIKAVIAESFERIHRSNLVGFGVLPLQFKNGESYESLGLDGSEVFDFAAIEGEPKTLNITAHKEGKEINFEVRVRIDTEVEWDYYRHGGILHYVLRQLAG
ncbi:aconitate hydratase AcnA [Gilvimarinus agarilyticus]|uniref:aconitate hydratase AcnA n=1 Tax=Gilvimarinus sp. 2_MG-2023 TaxID=3062666 RepID=UPI001C0A4E35|nr:aconitate hydratase AcnA [Gilvimarinus sp. 2_MG-2023]MBU2884272.1 aconitate hydratase AcnA [Gilvimarinus agarilyticus]MDO6569411.1 aconitate hydratase AcnA [Gilvimarinus sp. 2_MG-2023]